MCTSICAAPCSTARQRTRALCVGKYSPPPTHTHTLPSGRVQALADWLMYRWELSLSLPPSDPRHGIPAGGDEGDSFVNHLTCEDGCLDHYYSSAGNIYRGFKEAGEMWKVRVHNCTMLYMRI